MSDALKWWQRWLSAPRGDLYWFVPAAPRQVASPAISYSDASTDFGLRVVLLLPTTREVFWFRTTVSCCDVATLGRGSRLIRSRLRRPLLAYNLPHSLRASLPKC